MQCHGIRRNSLCLIFFRELLCFSLHVSRIFGYLTSDTTTVSPLSVGIDRWVMSSSNRGLWELLVSSSSMATMYHSCMVVCNDISGGYCTSKWRTLVKCAFNYECVVYRKVRILVKHEDRAHDSTKFETHLKLVVLKQEDSVTSFIFIGAGVRFSAVVGFQFGRNLHAWSWRLSKLTGYSECF